MKAARLVAGLLFLLSIPIVSFGQTDRGTITGTVTDPSGAVVSGAKVTVTNSANGEVRDTTTGKDGSYTLPQLPAAPYKVSIEAEGFKSSSQTVQLPVQ